MFNRHTRAIWMSAIISLFFSAATNGQIRRPARLPQLSERAPCLDEADTAWEDSSHIPRISFVSYLRTANECAADEPGSRHLSAAPTLPAGEQVPPSEPPNSEFQQLGYQGFVIARARLQVLDILREGNSCSAWYAGAEPNPWIKFASLHYSVDGEGEDTAVGDRSFFRLYYREPYVARAQQSVGAGSIITLNAHGAFFAGRAPARVTVAASTPLADTAMLGMSPACGPAGLLRPCLRTPGFQCAPALAKSGPTQRPIVWT